MVALNMIDTIGSGIRRMFIKQRERLFPMPDYDLTDPHKVRVVVPGKIIDPNYSRLLYSQTDLSLVQVIALDRVQKRLPITGEEAKALRALKLIEGRKPNYVVAAKIAVLTDTKAQYIKHRTLDKRHYKGLVIEYLRKFKAANRGDIAANRCAGLGPPNGRAQWPNMWVATGGAGVGSVRRADAWVLSDAPVIITQPVPQAFVPGGSATFNVEVGGVVSDYQWRKDGASVVDGGRVSGAMAAMLNIADMQVSDEGAYDCVVSNACASVTSDAADLSFHCYADFNNDGGIDGGDINGFFAAWESGDPSSDVNADGGIDGADVNTFFIAWEAGGCG